MRPVSDSFLATVRGSHQALFRARVVPYGEFGVTPDGATEIPIIEGNVIFDTRADVNGTLELETSYEWSTSNDGLLTPYGNEIFVERGVRYGEGTQEWVALGYFRIDTVDQNIPSGRIRITGTDRMSRVRDYRPVQPELFNAGTSVETVVEFIVSDAVPGCVFIWDEDFSSTLLTTDHILDDDRVKFLRELLTSYGKVAYFDYAGRYVVRSVPDYRDNLTDIEIFNGRNGVLVSMNRSISRDSVYNIVVARGESIGDSPPVQAIVEEAWTGNPINVNSAFGRVPRFFESPFMTTTDQCYEAARSLLLSSNGIPYVVEMGVVPNPAIEGWDVALVRYDARENREVHVIDSIYYPLNVDDPQVMTSRRQL